MSSFAVARIYSLIHLTYYATAFLFDLTSFLICADNPANTFLLIAKVAKQSDGTEMGDSAVPVANVCLIE